MDKTESVIEFLLTCPTIQNNKFFFNFLQAKDDNKQFVTTANDKNMNRKYIDGSELKRYTFTIIDYRSVAYQAVVKQPGYPNENMQEYLDVQGIIDWISTQEDIKNYPNFGEHCIIDSMRTLTDSPRLNGVDTSLTPALAKYSVSIQIDYLDMTNRVW